MEIAARNTLRELAVTTVRSIRQPVASLSGGQRQSVAVAKAVMANARLVIMDEPTAALGVSQTEQVLALIRRLADQGVAVLWSRTTSTTSSGSPTASRSSTSAGWPSTARRPTSTCSRSSST